MLQYGNLNICVQTTYVWKCQGCKGIFVVLTGMQGMYWNCDARLELVKGTSCKNVSSMITSLLPYKFLQECICQLVKKWVRGKEESWKRRRKDIPCQRQPTKYFIEQQHTVLHQTSTTENLHGSPSVITTKHCPQELDNLHSSADRIIRVRVREAFVNLRHSNASMNHYITYRGSGPEGYLTRTFSR